MAATLKARYYTADGKAGQAIALPADPFDGVVHDSAIYEAVKSYLTNQRPGTAAAKNRSRVSGGGRKPWRQKGTGRARAGTIRSPIWRGGGIVFPPVPRDYRQNLPKRVRRLARRSAFNARAADDRVVVVESFQLEKPKTRELVKMLNKLKLGDQKVLILTEGNQPLVYLSARNVSTLQVRPYGTETTYDVLWADSVLIEKGALAGAGVSTSDAKSDVAGEKVEEGADA